MRRRLFALFLLLTLLLGYLAYLNSLPLAVRAYKLARISGDEKLIAVYHDSNFWQFATYNPKTNTLKLYTVEQSSPLWLKKRKVESVKALVNYTPLALDLNRLKQYKPHEKALLFKTLGWIYNEEIRKITYPRISNVIDPDADYFEIIGSLSGKGIRIGAGDEGSAIVSWTKGVRGLLLLPGHIDSANTSHGFIWVTLLKNGSEQIIRAYYPRIILEHRSHTAEERPSFTGLFLQKTLNNTSVKLENHKTPEFEVLWFHVIQNRIMLDIIWKVSPEQICHAQKDLLRNTIDGPVCHYKTR